jgi:Fe-S-cluster containining protein
MYKKCCGTKPRLSSIDDKTAVDLFKLNNEIAYKGTIGQLRKNFCIEQINRLQEFHKQIIREQKQEAKARNQTITCYKGCSFCCAEYITASLQECESIVHYLYQHENILVMFLKQYKYWQAEIDKHEGILEKLYQRFVEMWKSGFTKESHETLIKEGALYTKLNIPCPFLKHNVCLIYEIRPLVCASQVATTPPDWCNLENPNCDKQKIMISLPDNCCMLPLYHESFSSILQDGYCMPLMVYNILKGGFWYLAQLTGSEELWSKVKNDPEVETIIKQHLRH